MTRLTRWIIAHKKISVAFWLTVTIVGVVFSQSATNALSQTFSLPGQSATAVE